MTRHEHTLRQSTVSTFDTCPERARRDELQLPGERVENDAACLGTAVHHAIEMALQIKKWDGTGLNVEDATEVALDHFFNELVTLEHFRWVKYSQRTSESFIRAAINGFWTKVYPRLMPRATEYTFKGIPIVDSPERLITVNGTIDYIGLNDGVMDWKTSGSGEYKHWEKQRWAIQPTVYLAALQYLRNYGPHPGEDVVAMLDGIDLTKFSYVVMQPTGAVQELTVTRSPADFLWLQQKLEAMAILKEAQLPVWPKNDAHALCSEKWCEHWASCKGLSL